MNKKIIIISSISIVLITSIVAYIYYSYILNYTLNSNNKPELKKEAEKISDVYLMKGLETGVTYKIKDNLDRSRKIEEDIKSSSTSTLASTLAYKKSIYYKDYINTTLASMDAERKDAVTYSYNGLYDTYNDIDAIGLSENKDMSLLKSSLVRSLNIVYVGSCHTIAWFYDSKWSKDPNFIRIKSKYTDPRLAYMIYQEYLFDNLPKTSDVSVLRTRVFNLAKVMNSYEKDLSEDDKKKTIKKIKGITSALKNLKADNGTSYAYSLETLSRYDKSVTSAEVLDAYRFAIAAVEADVKSPKDMSVFGRHVMYSVYGQYLYKLNNSKISPEIEGLYKKSIDMVNTFKAQEGVEEQNAIFKLYFSSYQNEMGKWDTIRQGDVRMAKDLAILKEFLVKQGAI